MSEPTTDVQALLDLAQAWRKVSYRNRYRSVRPFALEDDDPGPHITAIQLEWAVREIESLRAKLGGGDRE